MARKENIIRTNDKVANIATEYTSDKIPQFRKYITLEEFFQMNQNETTSSENAKIQWHPGFYAAAEIELRHNRNELEFHREYNLSKKPLQVDLLIIEKLNNIHLQNELGAIFRRYNIIEYKAPKDQLNIDVFFKTLGYAFLYKGLGVSANREIYDQVRRNNVIMCEALKELFKDELEEAHEKGRSAGLSEGRAAGLTEGMFKGRTEGENRLKTLYAKLKQDGRREEIFQALSDPEILKKLYEEYRIE